MHRSDLLATEHGGVLSCARGLLLFLSDFRDRLESGDVAHHQHYVFADRARSLALYLTAACDAVRSQTYPAAFCLLRSALEHYAVDLLVLLGSKHVLVVRNVDDDTWASWQADRAARADWTQVVSSLKRSKRGHVTIVRRGLHERGGETGPRARALSLYYFLIDEFDPFSGKPSAQDLLTRGFFGPEVHIEHAKRSRDIYERWLSWIAIKDNLLANGLFGTRDLVRLDVHYGFLSAFVHPAKSACELAYGRDEIDVDPPYDHYSAELALLYVVVLAAGELRALGRMSKRAPRVGVRDWSEIEEGLQEAESVSSHLWFPPDQGPHQFDRVEEANHRSTRRGLPIRRGDRVLPEQLTDRMVRYYRNPLERLIRMHSSFVEGTTGIAYRSPWERPDALHRRV